MKVLTIMAIIACALSDSTQTTLNESGVYELKIVEQYDSVNAAILYERSLIALSDVVGSQERSKANIDVQDKEAGIIAFKGELFLGFQKVNTMCGYDVCADFTLKVRCKDGRAQYTITVPSITMYWSCDTDKETIPLREIIPEYTHKGRLHYLKKGALEYSNKIDVYMKSLEKSVVNKTIDAADDDF